MLLLELKLGRLCKQTCNPNYRLKITNLGYRGDILPEVFISDEEWIEEVLYDSDING